MHSATAVHSSQLAFTRSLQLGGGGGHSGAGGHDHSAGSVTSPSPLPNSATVSTSASLPHLEREHLANQDQDVRIWSVQYVPELYTVDRSLQRRPKKVVKV